MSTNTCADPSDNFTIETLMAIIKSMPPAPPRIQPVPDAFRVQFRFPRSKSRRIRKKWAKRAENFRWQDSGYPIGGLHDRANNVVYVRQSVMNTFRTFPNPGIAATSWMP